MIFQVMVQWAPSRPPVAASAALSLVCVEAQHETDAMLLACQMVACRPECVMPTDAVVVGVNPVND